MDLLVNKEDQKHLISIVRTVIESKLELKGATVSDRECALLETEDYGSFVTLTIDGNLRGCIGYITPVAPLKDQIEMCAESAAFNDYRFGPLQREEYPSVHVEISLLSPIEVVDNIEDIQVGRDGLIISKGHFQGLLLPQVATEYGWSRDEFLDHTCMKAGLSPGSWKDDTTVIKKFSATVFGE